MSKVIREEVIFENKYYKTIIQYLDNGNKIPYTEWNQKLKDNGSYVPKTQEDKLDDQLDKMWFRR